MKKIDVSLIVDPNKQQPFLGASVLHLQEAYQEAVKALAEGMIKDVSGPVALWGCENTGTAPNVIIHPGVIYYNGEIFLLESTSDPAYSITPGGGQVVVGVIDTAYRAGVDPVTFSDMSTQNVHAIRTIKFQSGTSGSGDFDYSALSFVKSEDWIKAYGAADADKILYRKDRDGFVHLSGSLGTVTGQLNFTLPRGYRPKTQQRIPCPQADFGVNPPTGGIGYVQITTGGVVTHSDITGSGTARNASLNGICFRADAN